MTRIVIISDTHGLHLGLKRFGEMPKGDILIHAGDISEVGEFHDVARFLAWFNQQPYEYKIFIAGNHDFLFETNRNVGQSLLKDYENRDIYYLEDSEIELLGLKFWGSPITPPFMNWAFNRDKSKRLLHWSLIPDDTDILITHGPPHGVLDFSGYKSEHAGCEVLYDVVKNKVKPLVHIFGHIHSNYGHIKGENTLYINGSTLNERYHVTNRPIVIDVDKENKTVNIVKI